MFTATADLILPTTVTGSWPRPRWYEGRLDGRALSSRMKDVVYCEQFTGRFLPRSSKSRNGRARPPHA